LTAAREQLVDLARQLPEAAVPEAVVALRRLRQSHQAQWPPPWFGSVDLDGSVADNLDEWLADGFGQD
jgi:hypothetical protein